MTTTLIGETQMQSSCVTHDMLSEKLLSLAQAARRLPPLRADRPVSPATIWRWVAAGVRLSDGSTLRLEAVRIGGRWVTSVEAMARFAERQTAALRGEAQSSTPRTAAQQRRASERASKALES